LICCSAGGTPTNEDQVLVCIGVVDVNVDELETGVVDQAAPRGVREDAEEVVAVLTGMLGPESATDPLADPLR
jgi:hypothetical protein